MGNYPNEYWLMILDDNWPVNVPSSIDTADISLVVGQEITFLDGTEDESFPKAITYKVLSLKPKIHIIKGTIKAIYTEVELEKI